MAIGVVDLETSRQSDRGLYSAKYEAYDAEYDPGFYGFYHGGTHHPRET